VIEAVRLVKSLGVGFMAAVLATIVALVLLMLAGYAHIWMQMSGGSGGIGGYQAGLEFPLLAGLVGGLAGFFWQWRRGHGAPVR
jgi:ABC-type glycerol-3-phosphate transport system permease component